MSEGGAILADVRREVSGTLILLRKTSPEAVTGRVLARPGSFMWLRARVDNPLSDGGRYTTVFNLDGAQSRRTEVDPRLLDDPDFRFVVQRCVPLLQSIYWAQRGDAAVLTLHGSDASWADILRSYLNRGDLLHDLQETVRQLAEAVGTDDTPARSVKTITREGGGRRNLSHRLTDDQVRELIAAFEAGTTRMELAKRYGIGRTSVAKLLRQWREDKTQEAVE